MDNHTNTGTLQHHGVKGQRWGVRRYQNKDGSLTALGEKRMGIKTGVDKKLREDLKDRRAARRLNVAKQRQSMMQETLDRMNARRIERAKIKLAQKKAQEEAADQATNRKLAKDKLKSDDKLAKDKLKIEEKNQQQDALDRATNRKLAKDKFKLEKEESRRNHDTPDDEYYELPDTPERQKSSSGTGKKLVVGALAVAGSVAAVAAAKKYGPTVLNKLKNIDWSKFKKSAKDTKDYADLATEVYNEASKYRNTNSSNNTLSEGSNTPLLSAPKHSTESAFTSAMSSLKDIPLYLGS